MPSLVNDINGEQTPKFSTMLVTACSHSNAVDRINDRFRRAVEPSSRLEDAGVVIHHFDTYENPKRWWQGCPAMNDCAATFPLLANGLSGMRSQARLRKACVGCTKVGDRFSATAIYRGLQRPDRPDRRHMPMVTSHPGIVLRPNAISVLCVYGVDGGTGNRRCPRQHAGRQSSRDALSRGTCVPGCGDPPAWCECKHGNVSGSCRCGFERDPGSTQVRPWRPEELGWVLREHARKGQADRGLGTYTGFPELVIDSENVAPAIEAVFFPVTPGERQAERVACLVHREFLREFRLSSCDVPLLRLRPDNWDEPFEVIHAGACTL